MKKITVSAKVAMVSSLIKQMIDVEADDDEGSSEDEAPQIVPLPNVKEDILKKVIEFMKYHVDKPMTEIDKPLRSDKMEEVCKDEWDAKYIDVSQELLFEIILAANYMDIKSLLDLSCAKVATMIKGKTPSEIRKTFNITEDFTPAEEIKVRADNPWLEDV